ncbi:hypothetical protein Tco_1511422 [Tanacetum coccineum]
MARFSLGSRFQALSEAPKRHNLRAFEPREGTRMTIDRGQVCLASMPPALQTVWALLRGCTFEINVPEEIKPSCEDPPDLELKDLPSHLEYAFLEGDDKLPIIIAKNLKDEDKTALIKVLKSHKRAILYESC